MLMHEVEKNKRARNLFFATMWWLNAFLTFVYGWDNLHPIFSAQVAALGFGDGFTALASRLLGGGMALLVCDVAYKAWMSLKLSAETAEQMGVARFASVASLSVSLWYTALSILQMSYFGLFSAETIAGLAFAGALILVGMVILQIVCAVIYTSNSEEARQVTAEVSFNTKAQSEQLAAQASVHVRALQMASQKVQAEHERLANDLALSWGEGLTMQVQERAPKLFASSQNGLGMSLSPLVSRPQSPMIDTYPPTASYSATAEEGDKSADDFLSVGGV